MMVIIIMVIYIVYIATMHAAEGDRFTCGKLSDEKTFVNL